MPKKRGVYIRKGVEVPKNFVQHRRDQHECLERGTGRKVRTACERFLKERGIENDKLWSGVGPGQDHEAW